MTRRSVWLPVVLGCMLVAGCGEAPALIEDDLAEAPEVPLSSPSCEELELLRASVVPAVGLEQASAMFETARRLAPERLAAKTPGPERVTEVRKVLKEHRNRKPTLETEVDHAEVVAQCQDEPRA